MIMRTKKLAGSQRVRLLNWEQLTTTNQLENFWKSNCSKSETFNITTSFSYIIKVFEDFRFVQELREEINKLNFQPKIGVVP